MSASLKDLIWAWRADGRARLLRELAGVLGRVDLEAAIQELDREFSHLREPMELASAVLMSAPAVRGQQALALNLHLYCIHRARLQMVVHLVPAADRILDLGGAHCPLYQMAYPHAFAHLSVVDLPAAERHEAFRNALPPLPPHMRTTCRVDLLEQDMTKLDAIDDASVDLVWSGQSIEHIEVRDATRMCAQVFRVLKPGGAFCLDTPNRLLTRLHTQDIGGGFIHPDHRHEYTPDELRGLIEGAGFEVHASWGVQDMPLSRARGRFQYEDFLLGGALTSDPSGAYVQFLHARRPAFGS